MLTVGSTGVEYNLDIAVLRGSGELIARMGNEGEEKNDCLERERDGQLIAAAFRSRDR